MRSPASQNNISCGQILCYDMGWNAGQDAGIICQHCPAALPLPVVINNTRIVNRAQQESYCNGFIDGQQAVAEHPGVRSHISRSVVLPHNATGFSDTIKIMPNGSAAEIVPPHVNYTLPNYTKPAPNTKTIITNQKSTIASKANAYVVFAVPANITNVYFSVFAEVVGGNTSGRPGINTQLYDITECHRANNTLTSTDLQPDGHCGISVLDARGLSAMKGSIQHIRLAAARNYILAFTNDADRAEQITHTAYYTFTYVNGSIPIVVGKGPYKDLFDPDNGNIYVANTFSNSVSVISAKTNSVIAHVTQHSGETPRELAYDSANGKLFVANVYSNTVTVIDTSTNKLIDRIPVGSITNGVVFDSANGNVYAINAGSPVSIINGSTDKVIANVPVGSNSLDGVFDPANGYLYVFNPGSRSVSVINGATNTVLTTIDGLPSPVAGAYDSANRKIYVANYGTNLVSVIDGSTNKLVNTIAVGEGPTGALFDPDNNRIYVANQGHNLGFGAGNTLSVIDGSNNSIVDKIVITGPSPVGLAYDPDNHNIYITNFGSNEHAGNTVTILSLLPMHRIQ
jgi:YVTN family beta-propeller protein